MPIYEYKCIKCGYSFDAIQTFEQMKNKPFILCPKCNDNSLTKIFGSFNAHYKGSGFYTTEQRGITGRKRKPNIKIGDASDLNE